MHRSDSDARLFSNLDESESESQYQNRKKSSVKMSEEVMRFEITDQDLEDEMTSSYGAKRKYGKDVI